MQNNQNTLLFETLWKALKMADPHRVAVDIKNTFSAIGVPDSRLELTAMSIVTTIVSSTSLEEAEKRMRSYFLMNEVNDQCFQELINKSLDERVEKIYTQVVPFIDKYSVFDYGCGTGLLAEMISKNHHGHVVECGDIRDFRPKPLLPRIQKQLPFKQIADYHVDVDDAYYECTILTNVLHHDLEPDKIIAEASRISSQRLIIIETVPEGEGDDALEKDWNRMFINDVMWNRFFNDGNIPVPGTYDIPDNWIRRIEKHRWKCVHSEDLGIDQPTIQDRHHLLVFDRIN